MKLFKIPKFNQIFILLKHLLTNIKITLLQSFPLCNKHMYSCISLFYCYSFSENRSWPWESRNCRPTRFYLCVVVLRQRRGGASTSTNTLTILVSFHIISRYIRYHIQYFCERRLLMLQMALDRRIDWCVK